MQKKIIVEFWKHAGRCPYIFEQTTIWELGLNADDESQMCNPKQKKKRFEKNESMNKEREQVNSLHF